MNGFVCSRKPSGPFSSGKRTYHVQHTATTELPSESETESASYS